MESLLRFVGGPGIVILLGAIISVFGAIVTAGGVFWLQIQQRQNEAIVLSSVTGGDSFCYIRASITDQGYVYFSVAHEGEYTLFNLKGDLVSSHGNGRPIGDGEPA